LEWSPGILIVDTKDPVVINNKDKQEENEFKDPDEDYRDTHPAEDDDNERAKEDRISNDKETKQDSIPGPQEDTDDADNGYLDEEEETSLNNDKDTIDVGSIATSDEVEERRSKSDQNDHIGDAKEASATGHS
jgi:hypothetical protein